MLQVNKTRTTAYNSQFDGLVERLNRTIKDMLSKYLTVHQIDWDKYVDGLVLAYNTTPHETTGITPYRMVFGNEASIHLNIMTEINVTEEEPSTNESAYVGN